MNEWPCFRTAFKYTKKNLHTNNESVLCSSTSMSSQCVSYNMNEKRSKNDSVNRIASSDKDIIACFLFSIINYFVIKLNKKSTLFIILSSAKLRRLLFFSLDRQYLFIIILLFCRLSSPLFFILKTTNVSFDLFLLIETFRLLNKSLIEFIIHSN